MEEHFINYNQALALKELGFNEKCFAAYRDSEWIGHDGPNSRYFHAQLFSNHQFDDDQKNIVQHHLNHRCLNGLERNMQSLEKLQRIMVIIKLVTAGQLLLKMVQIIIVCWIYFLIKTLNQLVLIN